MLPMGQIQSLNHVDQFLAIFDPPLPPVALRGLLNDPPNNYVDFWKTPPPLRTFFSPSLFTAYIVCKSVDKNHNNNQKWFTYLQNNKKDFLILKQCT